MGELSKLLPGFLLLEEHHARVAQLALRQQANMEVKLKQLVEYRSEYRVAELGVPTLMLDAQYFLDRLDSNIAEIKAGLERQSKLVQLETSRWQSMHARRLALQKLIDKQNRKQRVIKRRKENALAESLQGSHRLLNSKKD